jgi:hypothetical protein
MNKHWILLAAFGLAACGGESTSVQYVCTLEIETGTETCREALPEEYVDEAELTEDAAPTGDFGQSEQALMAIDPGYGGEGNTAECLGAWTGGICTIPKDRTFKVYNTCSGATDSACNAISDALQVWAAALNPNGFSVSFVGAGAAGLDTTIEVNTNSNTTDGLLGTAALSYNKAEQINGPAGSNGKYQRYFLCSVELDIVEEHNALLDPSIYPTAPVASTQRQNAYFNQTLHELGHCAGLGHHAYPNVMSSDWPRQTGKNGYEPFQKTWLAHYVQP